MHYFRAFCPFARYGIAVGILGLWLLPVIQHQLPPNGAGIVAAFQAIPWNVVRNLAILFGIFGALNELRAVLALRGRRVGRE